MARTIKEQTGVDPGPELPAIPDPEPSATEEEDTRPEWLDPKFENVEAQAKAYSESQRAMSQAIERQRQTEQRIEELAAQMEEQRHPQQQQPPGIDQFTLVQQYEQALEQGDAMSLAGLNAYMAQQVAQQVIEEKLSQWQPPQQEVDANSQVFAALAEQQVAARYGPEWETLKPEVGQLLTENPYLLPDTGDLAQTVNALSLVTDMVKARQGATAQQAQDAGRQQKLLAQTMSGTSGRPDTQQSINVADHLQALMSKAR